MAGDVAVRPFGEARKCTEDGGQRAAEGKGPSQRLGCCTGREELSIATDEMPGVETRRWINSFEQALALFALDRDSQKTPRAIPREDLVERPLAEATVSVVEDDALAGLRAHPAPRAADSGVTVRPIQATRRAS